MPQNLPFIKIAGILASLWCLLPASVLRAQLETAHWFFYNSELDFTTGTPQNEYNGTWVSSLGGSCISDENGNLLFYTDGDNVYNRNRQIMPHGMALGTGFQGDATQSAVIVPFPGNTGRYFIFTTDDTRCAVYGEVINCNQEVNPDSSQINNGLNYFVVNMNLDDGFGDIESNANLMPLTSGKLTAIRHGNGEDYWVVTHHTNKFYAFLITSAGVNPTPVVSTIGPYIDPELYSQNYSTSAGHLKISPDGTKLAVAHRSDLLASQIPDGLTPYEQLNYPKNAGGYVALYDFDAATGLVSNEVVLSDEGLVVPYGLEFSLNSKFLYVEYDLYQTVWAWESAKLVQYSLQSENIPESEFVLYDDFTEGTGTFGGAALGSLQLALDGKIYYALSNGADAGSLSVIQYPNQPGGAATFLPYAYQLNDENNPEHSHGRHLPQFIPSFFRPGLYLDGMLCVYSPINFRVTDDIDTIFWDFGDGNTSTELYPEYSYTVPGNYTVTATVTYNGVQTVYTKEITIHPVPVAHNAVLEECDNDLDGSALFLLDDSVPQINSGENVTVRFYASQADAENAENALNNEFVSSATPQTVYVRVENESGCAGFSELTLVTKPGLSVEVQNQAICPGNGSTTVEVPEGYVSYHWEGLQGDDQSQPVDLNYVTITQAGEYSVTVTNENACSYTETFTVDYSAPPQITEMNFQTGQVAVAAEGNAPFEYSLDGVFWQASNVFYNMPANTYTLYIRDANGCIFKMGEFGVLMIPNFISPNGDGYNDSWKIRGLSLYPEAAIKIFDRYNKIFIERKLNGTEEVWDGHYLGSPVPSGTYWYILEVEKGRRYLGSITVKN
jgi:gliding motility-associated-like protein